MTNECVRVSLGERSYEIYIGAALLENAGALIKPHLTRPRIAVVTDENVYAAQSDRLKEGLKKEAIDVDFVTLSPGEATKSFKELETLTGKLLDLGVERNDLIAAFGGGVIGDITGFAASVLRRGCRFAQIPTTLLAQVDSAVGGKTAINVPQGKNLVGAFHQPSLVLSDLSTLRTLPERELRAGYAEVVKYGLINDEPFFHWLEENGETLLNSGENELKKAVKTSCEAKASIVSADEMERGQRALLNLGHTFGHAFEATFGYSSALLHGEAVALGMTLAFEYASETGICPAGDTIRVKSHLTKCGLPVSVTDLHGDKNISAEALVALMMQDKKVEDGKLTLILPQKIGAASIVKDASVKNVQSFLEKKLA